MAETELVALRGRSSKTFDLGNGKRRLEVGGAIAHHRKNGAWVDTDCVWRESGQEYLTGEYPYQVKVNKGTKAVTVLVPPATEPFTLAPIGHDRKASATYADNVVTIPALWAGVNCYVILFPDYPLIEFERTSDTFTNPKIQVIGTDATPMLNSQVPATLSNGIVTYDLSAVPVGERVR